MSSEHIWRAALERLKREMTHAQFETWLRGTKLRVAEDGSALLGVRTTFARELLESRYRARIESAIAAVIGRPCTLEITVATGHAGSVPQPAMTTSAPARATTTHASPRDERHTPGLVRPSLFAMTEEPPSPELASTLWSHTVASSGTSGGAADQRERRTTAASVGGQRRLAHPGTRVASLKGARVRAVLGRSHGTAGPARADGARAQASAPAPLATRAKVEAGGSAEREARGPGQVAPMPGAAGDPMMSTAEHDRHTF